MELVKKRFFNNPEDNHFYAKLISIAFPQFIQLFIGSMLSFTDSVIVGGLGTAEIAAVGLSNQVYFVAELCIFGVTSGASIFSAQMWGKGDKNGIRKVLMLCIIVGLAIGLSIAVISVLFPVYILQLFSRDKIVIEMGASYLAIMCFSAVAYSISCSYSSILRSIGSVRMPVTVTTIILGLNTFLGFGLVYGKFGMPNLGLYGAAWGFLISRVLEMLIMIIAAYIKFPELRLRISDYFNLKYSFVKEYFAVSTPVIINEIAWSVGVSFYIAAYAYIGTESIAARTIVNNLDKFSWVFFASIGNTCAVMMGHAIGAKDMDKVKHYTRKFIVIFLVVTTLIAISYVLLIPFVSKLFNVTQETRQLSIYLTYATSALMLIKTFNYLFLIGFIRSGGDTKFGLYIDVVTVWVIGVPAAYFASHILNLPVHWAYVLITTEEVVKFFVIVPRIISGKWIKNVV